MIIGYLLLHGPLKEQGLPEDTHVPFPSQVSTPLQKYGSGHGVPVNYVKQVIQLNAIPLGLAQMSRSSSHVALQKGFPLKVNLSKTKEPETRVLARISAVHTATFAITSLYSVAEDAIIITNVTRRTEASSSCFITGSLKEM
jgi:hypothetical protein